MGLEVSFWGNESVLEIKGVSAQYCEYIKCHSWYTLYIF